MRRAGRRPGTPVVAEQGQGDHDLVRVAGRGDRWPPPTTSDVLRTAKSSVPSRSATFRFDAEDLTDGPSGRVAADLGGGGATERADPEGRPVDGSPMTWLRSSAELGVVRRGVGLGHRVRQLNEAGARSRRVRRGVELSVGDACVDRKNGAAAAPSRETESAVPSAQPGVAARRRRHCGGERKQGEYGKRGRSTRTRNFVFKPNTSHRGRGAVRALGPLEARTVAEKAPAASTRVLLTRSSSRASRRAVGQSPCGYRHIQCGRSARPRTGIRPDGKKMGPRQERGGARSGQTGRKGRRPPLPGARRALAAVELGIAFRQDLVRLGDNPLVLVLGQVAALERAQARPFALTACLRSGIGYYRFPSWRRAYAGPRGEPELHARDPRPLRGVEIGHRPPPPPPFIPARRVRSPDMAETPQASTGGFSFVAGTGFEPVTSGL